MNRQLAAVALVGVVSGGIGSALVAAFSTRAVAAAPQATGKAYIVQVTTSPSATGGAYPQTSGLLFRLWSDGKVDMVAYSNNNELCNPFADVCLVAKGFVPSDLSSVADLNRDGIVDGADMGVLLGEWDGTAAR